MLKKKKKTKRHYNTSSQFPVIGKYIDTVTKAELDVLYFIDELGTFKISIDKNLPDILRPGCRIQLRTSEVKRKRKFFKRLNPYLEFSSSFMGMEEVKSSLNFPLIFGLIKVRKGKQREFVVFRSADTFYKNKTINVVAMKIDNLLYLDLLARVKNKLDNGFIL